MKTIKKTEGKKNFAEASIRELIASEEVQNALKKLVSVPEEVMFKKIKNPYTNSETKITTQKVEAISGTSIWDVITVPLTLVEIKVDPVDAINKVYRLVDYTLALEANMSGKNFQGYSATGFKLLVTKIEEVRENKNETKNEKTVS